MPYMAYLQATVDTPCIHIGFHLLWRRPFTTVPINTIQPFLFIPSFSVRERRREVYSPVFPHQIFRCFFKGTQSVIGTHTTIGDLGNEGAIIRRESDTIFFLYLGYFFFFQHRIYIHFSVFF